jgi:hypothetical protein
MIFFGKPVSTHSASQTRVNALVIKVRGGLFRDHALDRPARQRQPDAAADQGHA